MKITIDDVELWAKRNNFTIVADEWWENVQDIICKYQKIEQIMKKRYGRYYIEIVQEIKEVIEDGNDNSTMDNSNMRGNQDSSEHDAVITRQEV